MSRTDLILKLHQIGAIKFGSFTLKSGVTSPIYIDLRLLVSYPDVMELAADAMWEKASQIKFDLFCGVPLTALPIATALSLKHNIPMIMRRKEAKAHGTKKQLEGVFQAGERCLIVEDLITSGISTLETAEVARNEGLEVTDAILLLDREQGGKENLAQHGVTTHAVFTMGELLETLRGKSHIDETTYQQVVTFLTQNQQVAIAPKKIATYAERKEQCQNPAGKRLFQVMAQKETNLSFNPDVASSAKLLELADLCGPEICLLKTHVDILTDFTPDVAKRLRALADKHNFLIFEDRKFADIGSVVRSQYASGIYQVAEWADITNAHVVPGPGIIEGLKQIGLPKGRGLLVLAEMSSKGTLANGSYTAQAVAMAEKHADFVIGFVAMGKITDHPGMIHLTPGVQLTTGEDGLGQQFKTPQSVIADKGSDIIQVGRGIYEAADPLAAAKAYRSAGWKAYLERTYGTTHTCATL